MILIDTLIFDLDGTLLDTSQDLTNSVNYSLNKHGFGKKSPEEIKQYLGNGVESLIMKSSDLGSDSSLPLLETFKNHYFDNIDIHTKPYEGVYSLLEKLVSSNYKLGIVSNKYHDGVEKLVKSFKLDDYFDFYIGESESYRKKPYLDMINKLYDELNSSSKDSILIGDSEVDIGTAVNASIKSICVTWGFRSEEFLINKGADFIAYKPNDIFNIVSDL